MPAEPSKGGTVECKQCYRAAGQQARVQIEVHPGTFTCDRRYMLGSLFYTYRARVHLKAYCKLCRVHANLSGVIWKRGDVGGTVYPVQT